MSYQYQLDDVNERVADTDFEAIANLGQHAVLSGCGITYSTGDLDVTIAPGTVLVGGALVNTAGDDVTLVPDGSNDRYAYIHCDASGNIGITHGTASATPNPPEVASDETLIAKVLVDTGLTIANNASVKLDKRVPVVYPTMTVLKSADETVNNSTTVQDDDDFSFSVAASSTYVVEMGLRINSGTTPDFEFLFTAPTGASWQGLTLGSTTTAVNQFTDATGETAIDGQGADRLHIIYAVFTIGVTAGTVQFQWAQGTGDMSDTKVLENSWMKYRKVA